MHAGGRIPFADVSSSSSSRVKKAEIVNILEDSVEDLKIHSDKDSEGGIHVMLDFRGYEIKSVRLTLGREEKRRRSSGGWVVM